MAFYTGIDCPVCGQSFVDGEDIVTCPVCGTPSHRSCYEKLGRCPNADKHKEAFSFDLKDVQREGAVPQPVADGETAPSPAPTAADNLASAFGMSALQTVDPFAGSTETVGGEKIGDIAAAVRTKINYYLGRFKGMERRGNKLSWNWGAFLFGPYWFFFRRMNKLGALFLSIQVIAQLLMQTLFSADINRYNSLLETGFSEQVLTSPFFFVDPANTQKIMEVMEQANIYRYFAISLAVGLLLRLVCAVLANNAYQKRCVELVKKVRVQIDNPEMLERFTQAGYTVKTKTELLRMYLTQLGGTSFINVLTGYMGYSLVMMLISSLV